MPNIKSARKRMRTSADSRELNRAARARITTARRKLETAVDSGDRTRATEAVRGYASVLDKAAKRGAIKKNAASRRKARAAALVKRELP
jgi:small subunit ribosomal protein S20